LPASRAMRLRVPEWRGHRQRDHIELGERQGHQRAIHKGPQILPWRQGQPEPPQVKNIKTFDAERQPDAAGLGWNVGYIPIKRRARYSAKIFNEPSCRNHQQIAGRIPEMYVQAGIFAPRRITINPK